MDVGGSGNRKGTFPGRRTGFAAAAIIAALALLASLIFLSGKSSNPGRHVNGARSSPVAGHPVPPLPGQPLARLAATGDTGTRDAAVRATARRIALEGRQHRYDALLLLGDLIYEDGDAALVEESVLRPFSRVLGAGATLVPVLGNHDYREGEQQQILARLGRHRSWYTQRIGPVRIIVLDSNRVGAPAQTRWLRATLRTPQPPGTWTLAVMHHPLYSAGVHGSDLQARRRWSALFAQAQVPLVLAGHDHDYQRSFPQNGVTYVVSGAGARTRPTGHKKFTAVSTSRLHYLDLAFYADRIVARAIDQQGRLIDHFTIHQDGHTPSSTGGSTMLRP